MFVAAYVHKEVTECSTLYLLYFITIFSAICCSICMTFQQNNRAITGHSVSDYVASVWFQALWYLLL
jgi:hypothetical protein